MLPGLSVADFEVSPDETEVAFTMKPSGGASQIWLASLDRRSAPRQVVDGGDQVSFGAGGDLIFRALGDTANSLDRIKRDGSGRQRVSQLPILNKSRVSPDGQWVMAFAATDQEGRNETVAIPIQGGAPIRICGQLCWTRSSPDGRFLFVTVQDSDTIGAVSGRTLAIPVPQGQPLPDLPASGIPLDADWIEPPGTQVIERANVVPGLDPSTYVFVRTDRQRNLFRIPLH